MAPQDIQLGKKYWIKPDDSPPRPIKVSRVSDTQPPCFLCFGAEGEGFIVFAEVFIQSVEPEPVTL